MDDMHRGRFAAARARPLMLGKPYLRGTGAVIVDVGPTTPITDE